MFNKKKPEDLTDKELQQIIDRIIDNGTFRYNIISEVRHALIKDADTRQIALDKVNAAIDEILCNEDNLMNLKKAVIHQIDELHNVKILLDRIPHKGDQQ